MVWYFGADTAWRSNGVAAIRDGDVNHPRVRAIDYTNDTSDDIPHRLHKIRIAYHQFVRSCLEIVNEPIVVSIEAPYAKRANPETTTKLCMVQSVVMLVFWDHDATIYWVEPQRLKKFVIGARFKLSAPKSHLHRDIAARWEFDHECGDVMDAYALAHWSRCAHSSDARYRVWQQKMARSVTPMGV